MRTFHAEDEAEQAAWKLHSAIWRTISARFYNLHGIDLRKHVKWIRKAYPTINAGFDFVPVDAGKWEAALQSGAFQRDSRERLFGILPSVGSVAAPSRPSEASRALRRVLSGAWSDMAVSLIRRRRRCARSTT